ncbi:MAG: RDD family protein [Hyphomicrobiales bacterium]|nr:RDD family protein [Hyphomicrobiales bacterium]
MTNTTGYIPPQPQAGYYPILPREALAGVRTRRILALVFDLCFVYSLSFLLFLMLGVATFGLAWLFLPPLLPIVAFLYNGMTVSGRSMGTWGMRIMGLEARTTTGQPVPFLNAALHGVLFWLSWYFTGGLVLLTSLVTADKRCLHDILAGMVIVRRPS